MTAVRLGAVDLARRLGQPHPPTPEQAAVIESGLGPAVVVAGAGSGKTETMAARVVWLVANRLVTPDAVLGLTFTRKAAAELGARVRRRLAQWRRVVEGDLRADPGDDELRAHLAQLQAGEPTVLTYAAHAGHLVAEHALRLGEEPGARVLSPAVGWQLADTVSRRHPVLPEDIGAPSSVPRYVLALAGQLADHLVSEDELERFCTDTLAWFDALPLGSGIRSDHPGDTAKLVSSLRHRAALVPLVRAFAAQKRRLGAVDFADQMTLAARLAARPDVAAIERERWPAVLLDEYQDTGHAQVETLRGLFGRGHAVTAVGDPFQSIYGWRGASAGTMRAFATAFPRADGTPAPVFPLATSFRNDRRVLDVANTVAAGLSRQDAPATLRPAAHAGPGRVVVARTGTVVDEADWVATRLKDAWDAMPVGERTAAVLVRRRSQIPQLADALLAAGLPVEVVGLGGLLTTPEVLDVVATLRVLVQPDAGTAVARLLTGARWRVGPRDLAALARRARELGRPEPALRDAVQQGLFGDTLPGTAADVPDDDVPPVPSVAPVGLVEALDDLGPPEAYSAEGYRRLQSLSSELGRLRTRVGAPLPDLVADVERTIGVDLEVAARPDRRRVQRVHLDRLLDEAARFAHEADEASLPAFLAYLAAAEDEENGLEAGEAEVETERVQVLTVHGAKGLEWDVVALPGLVSKVFPAEPRAVNWTRTRQELPIPLRGDRADLPALDLRAAADRKEVRDLLAEHHEALCARHALEERRLAYVAVTRARHVLLASGYAWDTTKEERPPSDFLTEVRQVADEVDGWVEVEPGTTNPLADEPRRSEWPLDPFGPYPGDRGTGRRAAVAAGAALVTAARAGELPTDPAPTGVAAQWRADVDRLLAERAALLRADGVEVELPDRLSVSQLVELRRDPAALARRLHRPLPRPPAPQARRGTLFHTWLEQRWAHQSLLDVDELPGAADAGTDEPDFAALRDAFLASEWADRTPVEVEVPFETTLGGRVVRGRMDAVFGDGGPPDAPRWLVVDWKTGARPLGEAADAAAAQLAAYRLAWARLAGVPDDELHRVRAAFVYVRTGETVEPTRLLDPADLDALVRGTPSSTGATVS